MTKTPRTASHIAEKVSRPHEGSALGQLREVHFREWDCYVKVGYYTNSRTALQLIDKEDGSPVATATVNLPKEPLEPGEVFLKDWGENQGMTAALEKAGIIERTGQWVDTGFVRAEKCKLKGRGI